MAVDPQAQRLNQTIQAAHPSVYALLSNRGRAIYFPKLGILSQSAESKNTSINATIGTALEDNGSPMVLDSLDSLLNLGSTEAFNYAPSAGRPEIRAIWKEMMFKKNPGLAGKSFSLPVVTCALTHGLSMGGYLFIDDGDRIISPDLYWENYELVFNNAYGGRIESYPMFLDNRRFNISGLKEKLLTGPSGKRVVMLNFPNNPTGYTVSKSEAVEIRDLLVESAEAGNDLVVFIDDAYFGLVYEPDILQESMFSLLADAHERILAVKYDGPTKEDYVWGFRVGFITFGVRGGSAELYGALESKLAGVIRGNISSASNIGQSLLLRAYASPSYPAEKSAKYATLERRYRKIKEIVESHPEYRDSFYPLPFNSGYFMCIRMAGGSAERVRRVLIDKYSTGTIAQGDLLRIAFSSTPYGTIEALFENCHSAAKECA